MLAAACVNVSTLLVARADAPAPRLRAAPGARRQPARHRRAVHRRSAAAVGHRPRSPAPPWRGCRATRSARCTPSAAIPRPCSICRSTAGSSRRRPASRWSAPSRSRCCRRCRPAASTSRRPSRAARGRSAAGAGRGSCAACSPCRWRCRWCCSSAPACSRGRSPRLDAVDAGFDQRGLLLFRIDATSAGYAPDRVVALHDRIRERLAALPGVREVTYSRVPLLSRVRQNKSFCCLRSGRARPRPPVNTNGVAPDFFAAMALPIAARARLRRRRSRGRRRKSRSSTRRSRGSSSAAPIRSAGGSPSVRPPSTTSSRSSASPATRSTPTCAA